MNRDDGGTVDWRTLEAGRELDALVAERVMGLRDVRYDRSYLVYTRAPDNPPALVPRYSADRRSAFWVVDRMGRHPDGLLRTLHMTVYPYRRTYATFEHQSFLDGENWAEGNGDHHTPLAICRAALAAVGPDGWPDP